MKKRLIFLIIMYLAWLPIFAIQKPVFMLYNHQLAGNCPPVDYFKVIAHGLLLDFTIAGYLTIIPLLCAILSIWLPGRFHRKFLKAYIGITAVLIAAIFAIDIALYGYWGFRLDAMLLFYLRSPANAMASIPIWLFIAQLLMFGVYAYGIYWGLKRWIIPLFPETPVNQRCLGTLGMLLLGGILFIPIRGGVTTSTANVGMVYFSDKQFLNHAAINPCFSLFASLLKQQDFSAQFNFFPEEKRKALFDTLIHPQDTTCRKDTLSATVPKALTSDRPNILIVIMESFSANAIEVVGGDPGVTPNLNELSEEGILFTQMYANSFRTDRGLVSVLNGYLAQPTTSIMKYPVKSQTLPSIAKSLGKEGYTTDMLYGGDINFTNMQSYFFGSGYSKLTSDRDFPLSSRLNKWGANDDITFNHLFEEIKKRPADGKPWFGTFLTLSSHEPFEVPFHHLNDPYLNSVAFTDSCVGNFIGRLKELPSWKNTLVIFVSDHGFRYPETLNEFEPLRYHIPMLWVGGAIKEPRKINTYANQTDLAATLLNQLDLPTDEFTFSKDIFDPCAPHYAFYTFHNGFGMIDSTGVSVYDNESDKILLENPARNGERRLEKAKALLQTLYDDLGSR